MRSTESAAIIGWLDAVGDMLNPERHLHHRVTVAQLECMRHAMPPPQEQLRLSWGATVWPQPHEPSLVYLARCLAHHSAVTLLSPYLAVIDDTRVEDTCGGVRTELRSEVCSVVALRLGAADIGMVKTGWDALPCSCHHTLSDRGEAQQLLPLQYGGSNCSTCGRAFPLVPHWSARAYVVLRMCDGLRCPALVCGEECVTALQLGRMVRVLVSEAAPRQQQRESQLMVVHSVQTHRCDGGLAASFIERPPFSRQSPGVRCDSTGMKFEELCRRFVPGIVGHDGAKALLLLSTLHTLHRAVHSEERQSTQQPLHVLLLGPTRSGKSTLLQGIAKLYGRFVGTVGATVVVQGKNQTAAAARGDIAAALPSIKGDILHGGPVLTAFALVMDDVGGAVAGGRSSGSGSRPFTQLRELLEDGVCGAAVGTGVNGHEEWLKDAVFATGVQLVAAAHEEARSSSALARLFPLIALLTPSSSLEHSARIGECALHSVSRTRESQSRSQTRSSSRASSFGSCAQSGNASVSRDAAAALTSAMLEDIVRRAPSEAALLATMPQVALREYYVSQLRSCAGLVERATGQACGHLPLPASLRGTALSRGNAVGLVNIPFERHLRVLASLSMARLVAEYAGAFSHQAAVQPCDEDDTKQWTREMAEQVWAVYEFHMRCAAAALDASATITSTTATAPEPSSTSNMSLRYGAGCCLSGSKGLKRQRSRKAAKLHFAEVLGQTQARLGVVVSPDEARAIYDALGGLDTMSDTYDTVMAQLQHEGALLRRPGGWSVTM